MASQLVDANGPANCKGSPVHKWCISERISNPPPPQHPPPCLCSPPTRLQGLTHWLGQLATTPHSHHPPLDFWTQLFNWLLHPNMESSAPSAVVLSCQPSLLCSGSARFPYDEDCLFLLHFLGLTGKTEWQEPSEVAGQSLHTCPSTRREHLPEDLYKLITSFYFSNILGENVKKCHFKLIRQNQNFFNCYYYLFMFVSTCL